MLTNNGRRMKTGIHEQQAHVTGEGLEHNLWQVCMVIINEMSKTGKIPCLHVIF